MGDIRSSIIQAVVGALQGRADDDVIGEPIINTESFQRLRNIDQTGMRALYPEEYKKAYRTTEQAE